jgi:septum formation protein
VLTLASSSPQRRAILEQLGIEFRVRPADVPEITAGEPRELVVENALRKARAVAGRTRNSIIPSCSRMAPPLGRAGGQREHGPTIA